MSNYSADDDQNKLKSMKWWWCPLCSRPTRLLRSLQC